MNAISGSEAKLGAPEDWDRSGLPAWAYFSDEMLELEKEEIFRRHWQLACHVSDVPDQGDYVAFDVVGERALIVRGRDGEVRAFHNLCRHRGSRVVADEKGNCGNVITCPFHGWVYNLDGTLRGPAQPRTLPKLDPVKWGLKPVEMEIWNGFVFIRFKPGPQPSLKEIFARVEEEVAPYGMADMVPTDGEFWFEETDVNWKSVRDVDNEGYHVAMAHPALNELFGRNYFDEPFDNWMARSFSSFSEHPGKLWSVRAYKALMPEADWLPESHRKAWLYIGVFPNFVFGIYPDSVIFYQEMPLSTGKTQLRGACYRRNVEESREWRAARYLSGRIDAMTTKEDQNLTIWSCEATKSSGYDGIMLSDLEYTVRCYHDELRKVMPVINEKQEPARGQLMARNAELGGRPVE